MESSRRRLERSEKENLQRSRKIGKVVIVSIVLGLAFTSYQLGQKSLLSVVSDDSTTTTITEKTETSETKTTNDGASVTITTTTTKTTTTRKNQAKKNDATTAENQNKFFCPPAPTAAPWSLPPQKLIFGRWANHSAMPFLSQDIWYELVDHKRTFYLRPTEQNAPTMSFLQEWIQHQSHPVTLVVNNQVDEQWPNDEVFESKEYQLILQEPNLHAIYVGNRRAIPDESSDTNRYYNTKVKPLPLGLKWQSVSTSLYGEDKLERINLYSSVSTSAEQTKALFQNPNRTLSVWIRPMADSNRRPLYNHKENAALGARRPEICQMLKASSPNRTVCRIHGLAPRAYFDELKRHRFVVSPPGHGLDTHATWEALLAGCIPIIAKSSINKGQFDDLPIWIVESWAEVTDEAAELVSKEMQANLEKFKFEKIFSPWWKTEIHRGLCTISEESES